MIFRCIFCALLSLAWATLVLADDFQPLPDLKMKRRVYPESMEPVQKLRIGKKSKKGRRPASYSVSKETSQYPSGRKAFAMVGLFGGIGTLTSNDADNQQIREEVGLHKNTDLGLTGNVTLWKYFGIEGELFYSLTSQQTYTIEKDNGDTAEGKGSFKRFGVMANLKAQYPVFLSSVLLNPRVGFGYGLLSLIETNTETGQPEIEQSVKISNPYYLIGLEIEPISFLVVSADLIKSIGAKGNYRVTGVDEEGSLSPSVSRLRLGIQARVLPTVLVGAHYVQRKIDTSIEEGATSSEGPSGVETLNQILGSVSLEF